MRIPRTTLETTLDCGHSWEGLRFRRVGASVRGSSAYSESGGASSGSCTSRNSQGQTVLEGVEARSTNALRTVVRGLGGALDPYVWIEPLPSSTSVLAGRTAMSFASVKGVPASTSTSRFSTTSPSNLKSVMSAETFLPRVYAG